ncbi:proteasome 26S subunit, non-ATPase 1 [Phyllostomus discolor]|uniref:Proteasome 26S subunit, non-ATPase 1 n=1 Tax=Phyllostomus discolor TaxID=89673 RepID=A0A834AQE9_9CHIR|nr:proteasome 26S subunit, non-ATPase 1 [Phyllostomus discolor]
MMMSWPSLALFWPREYWMQVVIMSQSPCSPEPGTPICLLWLASLSLPSSGSGFLFHTSCHWLIPPPASLALTRT